MKTNKALQKFLKKTLKNYQTMKKEIGTIWTCVTACLILQSCGVTKAHVSQQGHGEIKITITTTQTPETEVSPNVELKTRGTEK